MFIICNSTTGEVEHAIYDTNLVTPELESRGVYVETVPNFPQQAGKYQKLFYDSMKKTFSVEYVPIPLTAEQRIAELEMTIAELMLGGGNLV
ncbi:hypothetical protein HMPREF1013_05299 [Bacillus sp. 2_A_57_CT2]|nr:hypothetical protein HMPREF1013_05299 [Bacillus sp. 2_A_57_CT2]